MMIYYFYIQFKDLKFRFIEENRRKKKQYSLSIIYSYLIPSWLLKIKSYKKYLYQALRVNRGLRVKGGGQIQKRTKQIFSNKKRAINTLKRYYRKKRSGKCQIVPIRACL